MDTVTLTLFIVGLVLLIAGAEVLVRGASRLAAAVGISPLVIGLTVVAFGTGSPEVAVVVQASLAGEADVGLGNVVGSNIANVLLILGLAALITPLTVSQRLVRIEVPLMISISILLLVLALNGQIGRMESLLLLGGMVAYLIFAVSGGRGESQDVQDEYERQYGCDPPSRGQIAIQLGLILLGLGLLVIGSRWLVNGAVAIATLLGISKLVIGLTVIAVGTSLPEIATSIIASLRGERDIAVGNAIGSNIFNILAVMGLMGIVSPEAIPVPRAALSFDLPVMVAVAVATLPIFFTGHQISRWEGGVFLAYYAAYTAYLVLSAAEHDVLPAYGWVMLYFVLPITAFTLGVLALRFFRARHRQQAL